MKKIVLASLLSVGVMSANNQPLKCVTAYCDTFLQNIARFMYVVEKEELYDKDTYHRLYSRQLKAMCDSYVDLSIEDLQQIKEQGKEKDIKVFIDSCD